MKQIHIIQHSNNTHFTESCSQGAPTTNALEEELELPEEVNEPWNRRQEFYEQMAELNALYMDRYFISNEKMKSIHEVAT
jgi:hypothetical protein